MASHFSSCSRLGETLTSPPSGLSGRHPFNSHNLGTPSTSPSSGSFVWSVSLQELSLGSSFKQLVVGIVWPASLRQLSLGNFLNQPIVGVVWSTPLQQLSLGPRFNQSIAECVAVVYSATIVRKQFQSAHRRGCVTRIPSAAIVRGILESVYHGRCVAGVPAAADIWLLLRPAHSWDWVVLFLETAVIRGAVVRECLEPSYRRC